MYTLPHQTVLYIRIRHVFYFSLFDPIKNSIHSIHLSIKNNGLAISSLHA